MRIGDEPPAEERSAGPTRARMAVGLAFVAATFVVALVNHLFSEKIAANRGMGWDGAHYGAWAADFPGEVLSKGLRSYHAGRILPSGLVYCTLGLLGLERSPEHIIQAFGVLNIACLTLSAWIWVLIARRLGLGPPGLALGYIGLFVNFFVLKWSAYYPVLTDMPTYLVGFLSLYFYLAPRRWALLATTAAGAFMWPTALPLGGLLLLFPREPSSDTDAASRHPALPAILAAMPPVILLRSIWRLLRTGWVIPFDVAQPIRATLVPSVLITLTCAFVGVWRLLDCRKLFEGSYWARRLRAPDFYVALAALAAIKLSQYLLSATISSPRDEKHFLAVLVMTSVARPGAFLVAHAVFYGPIVLLVLILWRPTCRLIHVHGIGLTLAATLGVLVGLCSEPRTLINVMPLVVPFTVLAAGPLLERARLVWAFAVLALISSKVWLKINVGPLTEDLSTYARLWQSYGPWIPTPLYFIQAAIVLLCALLLWLACRSRPDVGVPLPPA